MLGPPPIQLHDFCCCCCTDGKRRQRRRRFRWRIVTSDRWEYEDVGPDRVYAAVSYWCPYWPITRGRYFNERNFRGAPIAELVARAHAWQNDEYTRFSAVCEADNPALLKWRVINFRDTWLSPAPDLGRFKSRAEAEAVVERYLTKFPHRRIYGPRVEELP